MAYRNIFRSLLLVFVVLFGKVSKAQPRTYAKNGMVVCDNAIASQVGVDILKDGGNAIDAAIATAFALSVVHPQAGNIGGGGFLVYRDAKGKATTIDFREKAPLKATSDMFLDENGQLIKGSNHNTAKSIGVPGTVAGLSLAHDKYGSYSWKKLLQPSVDLANDGFPLSWALSRHAIEFQDEKYPDFIRHFFDNKNQSPTAYTEVWTQKALAKTLKAIRDKGKDGFYKGEVARKIIAFMKANNGLITQEDLDKYTAIERQPLQSQYKDYNIIAMPPPSSGGVAIIEMLNMLENVDFSKIDFNSKEYVHLLAEVMRRAFADRAAHLGDPDFNPQMPLEVLLSKDHAKMRYQSIDPYRASVSDASRFGHLNEGDHTTHISVIDKQGNAVSLTYTIEQTYGSKLGSKDLGFIFNNEMGDFNPQPGYTNNGWLIGTNPNIIEPEKRMLSSMSPTIVTKSGKPYLVIGSPGGRTIINTVFQAILAVLAYDMPIDKAIESSKIHHQWMPDRISYEKDLLSKETREALKQMGHKLHEKIYLGRLMGIHCPLDQSVYIGASDSSSPDGGVSGY